MINEFFAFGSDNTEYNQASTCCNYNAYIDQKSTSFCNL